MPVLDDPKAADRRDKVTRLVLCSGRVAIDLELSEFRDSSEQVAVARVEQLAPFQTTAIRNVAQQYPNLEEIVWVQEEPRNMGALSFMGGRLMETFPGITVRYVGRPERSSPAAGSADFHTLEQNQLVANAFAFDATPAHTNGNGKTSGSASNGTVKARKPAKWAVAKA